MACLQCKAFGLISWEIHCLQLRTEHLRRHVRELKGFMDINATLGIRPDNSDAAPVSEIWLLTFGDIGNDDQARCTGWNSSSA